MSKRTLTILRFNNTQFTFVEPIGSPELDVKLQQVWDSYLKFQNCEVVIGAGLETLKEIEPSYQDAIFSNKAVGLVPVVIMWIEKNAASNDPEMGATAFYPNIFHTAIAFLGRIEVEEKLTPLKLV